MTVKIFRTRQQPEQTSLTLSTVASHILKPVAAMLVRIIPAMLLQLQMLLMMRMVEATFRLQTANNGGVLCAVDTPSHSLPVNNINAAMFSVQVPPVVLCAHQCTAFGNCLAFNHKVSVTDGQTCEFYYYLPTQCSATFEAECSLYMVSEAPSGSICPNNDGNPVTTRMTTTTTPASCMDIAAASVPRISAENCHYPFTYNGRLYHECAENVDGVTSTCETHGCFALNYTKAVCAANLQFKAENVSINLTIPTEGSVPVMSVFGWIVFQQRDVATGFNWDRYWNEYKYGFGDSSTEDFWLGLERLHLLTTSANYRLRFEWQDQATDMWLSIEYWLFYIDGEANRYTMHVDGYVQGDDGRAIAPSAVIDLLQHVKQGWAAAHDGAKFSTNDNYDYIYPWIPCSALYGGGWWWSECDLICTTSNEPDWYNKADDSFHNVQKSRMMVKLQ